MCGVGNLACWPYKTVQFKRLSIPWCPALPCKSILIDVQLQRINSSDQQVNPEVELASPDQVRVGNVPLHQVISTAIVLGGQVHRVVGEEDATTPRETDWLHNPDCLRLFSFLVTAVTPCVQTALSDSHRLQDVLPFIEKTERFRNEVEGLFPKLLPELLVPPGNLELAAQHLGARHPVHLGLIVDVVEVFAGSVGQQVAHRFLRVCGLQNDCSSGWKNII